MIKSKHPKTFGRRPILMMRFNGDLRIIYANGIVEWTGGMGDANFEGYACTSRRTQEEAYKACVSYDEQLQPRGPFNYSAFLGYL